MARFMAITRAINRSNYNQIKYFANENTISTICMFISTIHPSNQLLSVFLECLKTILNVFKSSYNPLADLIEECGGVELLEELMTNNRISRNLCRQIHGLIFEYWNKN